MFRLALSPLRCRFGIGLPGRSGGGRRPRRTTGRLHGSRAVRPRSWPPVAARRPASSTCRGLPGSGGTRSGVTHRLGNRPWESQKSLSLQTGKPSTSLLSRKIVPGPASVLEPARPKADEFKFVGIRCATRRRSAKVLQTNQECFGNVDPPLLVFANRVRPAWHSAHGRWQGSCSVLVCRHADRRSHSLPAASLACP